MSDDHSDSSASDLLRTIGKETIDLDIEFREPSTADYQGIKQLMAAFFTCDAMDQFCFDFADKVSDQPEVGSVIKSDNSEDVLGFISVLPLRLYADVPSMRAFAHILVSSHAVAVSSGDIYVAPGATGTSFARPGCLLTTIPDPQNNFGLVCNNRYVNLPGMICSPMYKSLSTDIAWTQSSEYTAVLYPAGFFAMTHLIFLTKGKLLQAKTHSASRKTLDSLFDYVDVETCANIEDEDIIQGSTCSWTYKPSMHDSQFDCFIISVMTMEAYALFLQTLD